VAWTTAAASASASADAGTGPPLGCKVIADGAPAMNTVLLPDLSLSLDEHPLAFETLLSFVDGRAMMLNTFVPDALHELHSSYVDAGSGDVVASHLLVAPELAPEPSTETLEAVALTDAEGRRHCLLSHLATLREALELSGPTVVTLEVGEGALRLADSAVGDG
jgi:hypothetical protein